MKTLPTKLLSLSTASPGPSGLTTNQFLGAFGVEAGTGRIGFPVLDESGALDPRSPVYVSPATKPLLDEIGVMIHRDMQRILLETAPGERPNLPATNDDWYIQPMDDGPNGEPENYLVRNSGDIQIDMDPGGRHVADIELSSCIDDVDIMFRNTFSAIGELTHVSAVMFGFKFPELPLRHILGLAADSPWYEVGLAIATKLLYSGFFPKDPASLRVDFTFDQAVEKTRQAGWQVISKLLAETHGEEVPEEADPESYLVLANSISQIQPALRSGHLVLPESAVHQLENLPECGFDIQCDSYYPGYGNSSITFSPSGPFFAINFDFPPHRFADYK